MPEKHMGGYGTYPQWAAEENQRVAGALAERVTQLEQRVQQLEAAEAVIERVRALADAYARSMSGMFTGQLLARDIRAALDPAGPTDA